MGENVAHSEQSSKIENTKFLGSVVIPCSLSGLSGGEIRSAIYGGVIKVMNRNREVTSTEHKIKIRAESDNLIGRSIMSPSIGSDCEIFITNAGIRTVTVNTGAHLFNHQFDCISFTGTSIPNRDNIFVYVAQLAKNDMGSDNVESSESRQLFVFEFSDPFSAEQTVKRLTEIFKSPIPKTAAS